MRVFASGWSAGFDGPGRRWIVYLKGCDFRCRWCANPEGISRQMEILFYAGRGEFADRACPHGAVSRRGEACVLERSRCADCPDRYCVRTWRHPAFELAGEEMAVEDVVSRARACRPLFGPDGGVTFGGGEPTQQAEETREALDGLRAEGIHTALETNAGAADLERFFGAADLLICDLKCVTPSLHEAWTGASNRQVLENLRQAAREQADFLVRVPLVTGMNDSKEEMERIVDFLAELAAGREALRVEVLRLHHAGEPKYAALGKEYPMAGVAPPSRPSARAFVDLLVDRGIHARLGG